MEVKKPPRIHDVVSAAPVMASPRGVTLMELSSYLAAEHGGTPYRYHTVIDKSVTEGFLFRKNRRYYFVPSNTKRMSAFSIRRSRNRGTLRGPLSQPRSLARYYGGLHRPSNRTRRTSRHALLARRRPRSSSRRQRRSTQIQLARRRRRSSSRRQRRSRHALLSRRRPRSSSRRQRRSTQIQLARRRRRSSSRRQRRSTYTRMARRRRRSSSRSQRRSTHTLRARRRTPSTRRVRPRKVSKTNRPTNARRVNERHVCGSCFCGWLHPCQSEQKKKAPREEGQDSSTNHTETAPEGEPQTEASPEGEPQPQTEASPEEELQPQTEVSPEEELQPMTEDHQDETQHGTPPEE